ncbi:MAG: thioredoxin domain-containing protein [Bacteriovoracaceae bacterium]|nr:thioredoxin domain-containing protein [Bacteriovoracaceae bacterium]
MSDSSLNRLTNEKSAYLKHHDTNPVDWWAYGPEPIQLAKDQNKPIFMSIGYSSCHWCGVMNAESFNDEETAQYLNENFICIKVDKEEHPDLDNYYQVAAQLFSHSGGWPLSTFLLPDLTPYFAATYFPKVSDGKTTSFKEILIEMNRVFNEDRTLANENADKVKLAIAEGLAPKDKVDYQGHFPAPMAVMKAIEQFQDKENGGFGDAPKFPNFAFYNWAVEQMLEGMIEKTEGEFIIKSIERMLMGGMIDHAKGGVHRYSIDQTWTVPHFEKMLYDQAGLLRLLSKLSLIYPAPLVFDTMINTLHYVETEMLSEEGFFHAGQSADSEGAEGLYYTYTTQEFEDALNEADGEDELLSKNMEKLKEWFMVKPEGSFDGPLNIIRLNPEHKDEIYSQDGWELVRKTLAALAEDRKDRVPPKTDPKGVASWNFMMATALIDIMQYCKIDVIRHKANDIFNTILTSTYDTFIVAKNKERVKIKHSTTRELNSPYLEDYTTFAELQLRTYEITGNAVFKDNFSKALNYLHTEFIDGATILTRAKSTTDRESHVNQAISSFDNSFRSPASMLLDLTRRATALFQDPELKDPVAQANEAFIHEALKNPINSGEALRSLTYPDEVYRVVKVPRSWPSNPKFVGHMPYFLSRFVLDYHDEGETWQICNLTECEMQGEGVDNFLETLTPTQD